MRGITMSRPEDPRRKPKYEVIYERLQKEIREEYEPGDLLAPEQALAERFGVNRHTVRRAIEKLVGQGVLDRQQGRGTLVLSPPLELRITQRTRFTESAEAMGRHPGSQVLRKEVLTPPLAVAKALHQADSEPCVLIETLRLVDDVPIVVSSAYFPVQPYQQLLDSYHGGSLHGTIQATLGINPRRKKSEISATLPDLCDAKLLRMAPAIPVLLVKSINVDDTDRPMECTISRFRGDSVQMQVEP